MSNHILPSWLMATHPYMSQIWEIYHVHCYIRVKCQGHTWRVKLLILICLLPFSLIWEDFKHNLSVERSFNNTVRVRSCKVEASNFYFLHMIIILKDRSQVQSYMSRYDVIGDSPVWRHRYYSIMTSSAIHNMTYLWWSLKWRNWGLQRVFLLMTSLGNPCWDCFQLGQ